MSLEFSLPTGRGQQRDQQLIEFAKVLISLQNQIGFPLSSRGWAYQLEGFGFITKDQFDKVEGLINELRQSGGLPIDFVAEEESRGFSGVEKPETCTPVQFLRRYLNAALECESWYTPDWWKNEKHYIQMIVEKIDLKTLFEPVCTDYHIPIATTKGWSSKLQRAGYSRRFKLAEGKELKCVLLYCGDHDPDGLRISDFLRSNLRDLTDIRWKDGFRGYDPKDLTIDRFGLNYDFIMANNLTWIDNLITGSGKDLASPSHPNHYMDYVQDYLKKIGPRKCEANALVIRPEQARQLCREAIEKYLGKDALARFQKVRDEVMQKVQDFRDRTVLDETIQEAIDMIDQEEGEK